MVQGPPANALGGIEVFFGSFGRHYHLTQGQAFLLQQQLQLRKVPVQPDGLHPALIPQQAHFQGVVPLLDILPQEAPLVVGHSPKVVLVQPHQRPGHRLLGPGIPHPSPQPHRRRRRSLPQHLQ